MPNEISEPPSEPVWWVSMRQHGTVYTKARSWFEARQELGGNPMRVTNPDLLRSLDAAGSQS